MEYCHGGDLISHLLTNNFTHAQIRYYAAVALLCLEYLHNMKVMYRDLKLDNICLKKDGTPRLIDFGLSKADIPLGTYTSTFCGTFVFMPPEMFTGPEYTHTVDYWQLGAMIYMMQFRRNPFIANNDEQLASDICNKELKIINKEDPDLNEIVLGKLNS